MNYPVVLHNADQMRQGRSRVALTVHWKGPGQVANRRTAVVFSTHEMSNSKRRSTSDTSQALMLRVIVDVEYMKLEAAA